MIVIEFSRSELERVKLDRDYIGDSVIAQVGTRAANRVSTGGIILDHKRQSVRTGRAAEYLETEGGLE